MTAALFPWQQGCPHRDAAARWVFGQWVTHLPDIGVAWTGWPAGGTWSKGEHLARLVEGRWVCTDTPGEVLVVSDVDVWVAPDALRAAVAAVEQGAGWAVPHRDVHRLTQGATAEVLADSTGRVLDDLTVFDLDQPPYPGHPGGGIVILTREAARAVPLDPRFVGWGQEDDSWALALTAVLGPPWRGAAPLAHLWHPPQDRMTRRHGNPAGLALYRRYQAAQHHPDAMRALLSEIGDTTTVPTPPHLLPILQVLGDGGTVAHAERVHDLLAAARTEAVAAATPPDVAELQAAREALQDRVVALGNVLLAEFGGTEGPLRFPDWEDAGPCGVAVRVLRELAAEVTRFRGEHDRACKMVADMHAAAVGEVRGPIRGVVEDVADVRTAMLRLERLWGEALREINQLAGTDHLTGFYARVTGGQAPDVHLLIERSSLGTPDAAAARGSVPIDLAALESTVRRAQELAEVVHDPAQRGPLPEVPDSAYPAGAKPLLRGRFSAHLASLVAPRSTWSKDGPA